MKHNFKVSRGIARDQKSGLEIMKSYTGTSWKLWIGEEYAVDAKTGYSYTAKTLKEAIDYCETVDEFIKESEYLERKQARMGR
jgi:hypothetical protein